MEKVVKYKDSLKPEVPKEVEDFIDDVKDKGLIFENSDGYEVSLSKNSTAYKVIYNVLKEDVAGYRVRNWVIKNQDDFIKVWLFGCKAKEALGVLLVDMPDPSYFKYNYIVKEKDGSMMIYDSNCLDGLKMYAHKVTEKEAKEKYTNFRWVALEDLGNEY